MCQHLYIAAVHSGNGAGRRNVVNTRHHPQTVEIERDDNTRLGRLLEALAVFGDTWAKVLVCQQPGQVHQGV
jgi:hypothetical protein